MPITGVTLAGRGRGGRVSFGQEASFAVVDGGRVRVEEGLADVERRRDERGQTAGETAAQQVRRWTEAALRVHQVLRGLVDDEVRRVERRVHQQLRPERAVES